VKQAIINANHHRFEAIIPFLYYRLKETTKSHVKSGQQEFNKFLINFARLHSKKDTKDAEKSISVLSLPANSSKDE